MEKSAEGPNPERGTIRPAPTFPIVGVGAAAGGIDAFRELLSQVPTGNGLAFVLINHLDPTHPNDPSATLARATGFRVLEIEDGMSVEPDCVYLASSHADVGICAGKLTLVPRLSDEPKPHQPIDFFFRSLAADLGNQAIGVVLSGTGSDGVEGLRAIKAADGVTFAQDPRSAAFGGMPEAAVAAGAVDICLPVLGVTHEIVRVGRHPFFHGGAAALASPEDEGDLGKVLLLVSRLVGIDFSEYKRTGIRRRLARRMTLNRVTKLDEYVRLLRADRGEVQALSDDILVPVTSFFRDGDAFEKLKQQVFPEIVRRKRAGGTIRIWSVGCSTGEEPYSILIALFEYLAQTGSSDLPIQLFGTDVSAKAVEKARAGLFSHAVMQDISAERRARFFTSADGGSYRISKSVRERCAFSVHDVATAPAFSRLDLIVCRNILAFFGHELQRRVLGKLRLALDEPGFLVLGRGENIADGANPLTPIDKENKIFARAAAKTGLASAHPAAAMPVQPSMQNGQNGQNGEKGGVAAAPDLVRRTERLLLQHYAPPGVIVNGRMEILHFLGRTGPYLEPVPGQTQPHLLTMARRGLVAELRAGIAQARKEGATIRRVGVRVKQDGSTRSCDVVVAPISAPPESPDEVFAVFFEQPARSAAAPSRAVDPGQGTRPGDFAEIEDELRATKEYLQWRIDEHQRANEELLSANEELVSSNDELQSMNRELHGAKGEIQSTNEELSVLNGEIRARNTELKSVNGDLLNILASVEVPIVIVDAERRIRRFTPKARPILNILPEDVGRPIEDLRPNVLVDDLDGKLASVIDTVAPHEEEVQSRDGRWYRLQIRPYTTVDKQIDGAVLSLVDIDILKRALGAAEWARDHANATVEAVQVPLVVLTETLAISSTNRAFKERYGAAQTPVQAGGVVEAIVDHPALRSLLEGVRQRDESFEGFELDCELPHLGRRCMSLSARSVPMPAGRLILLAIEDITGRRRDEAERAELLRETQAAKAGAEQANRTKDIFLATLSHELRTPLSTLLLSAELLRSGLLPAEKFQRTVDSILRATKAQAQLIDDLFDISRVVTGKLKMELRAVNVAACIQAAVDAMASAVEEKQLQLEVEVDTSLPPVPGDPMRLQQVVSNLLTNAIKFTPAGGRVRLTVEAVEDRAQIRVTDTGVGIEADFLPRLFDSFSQEDRGETRAYGGLGLGLAIVRHLVEAHGGSVRAESAGRGQGATFTVVLPLMRRSQASRLRDEVGAPEDETVVDVKGVRILVVDDDPGARAALGEMLILSGAEVWTAESAADAMNLVGVFRPELLVCDVAMPDEGGYSLVRRIRALSRDDGGRVPAVAMTALASAEDRRNALEAGFDAHVAKPIDIDRLLTVLTRLLQPTALQDPTQ